MSRVLHHAQEPRPRSFLAARIARSCAPSVCKSHATAPYGSSGIIGFQKRGKALLQDECSTSHHAHLVGVLGDLCPCLRLLRRAHSSARKARPRTRPRTMGPRPLQRLAAGAELSISRQHTARAFSGQAGEAGVHNQRLSRLPRLSGTDVLRRREATSDSPGGFPLRRLCRCLYALPKKDLPGNVLSPFAALLSVSLTLFLLLLAGLGEYCGVL